MVRIRELEKNDGLYVLYTVLTCCIAYRKRARWKVFVFLSVFYHFIFPFLINTVFSGFRYFLITPVSYFFTSYIYVCMCIFSDTGAV